jgi:tetratricopeptide (TPR) repeat protein
MIRNDTFVREAMMAASSRIDRGIEARGSNEWAAQQHAGAPLGRLSGVRRLAARLVIASACLQGNASAQDGAHDDAQDKAAAEALFDQGRDLIGQGQYEAACRLFQQSQALDPGVGTLLYLGDCYERVGRQASAWAMYREAFSAAQAAGQVERSVVANERLQRLTPLLSKLTVRVAPENRIDGFEVVINDNHVSSGLFDVAFPVDAGRYRLLASAPGRISWSALIEVRPGGDQQIVLVPALPALGTPVPASATAGVMASAPAAPAASGSITEGVAPAGAAATAPVGAGPGASDAVTATPEAADAGLSLTRQQTAALIVAGGGVLALGVGVAFGVNAKSKDDDAKADCPAGCATQEAATLNEEARTSALLANVSYGLGFAAIATGAVLYFTGAAPDEPQTGGLRVTPELGAEGGMLSVSGAF